MFHSFRDGNRSVEHGLLAKLWRLHDRHPLPPAVNGIARSALFQLRRAVHRWNVAKLAGRTRDELGDGVVPDRSLLPAPYAFDRPGLDAVAETFERVHAINERLRCADGSWVPQPRATYARSGISIEEVALRVSGYLSAYRATRNPAYLDRADAGGRYLLRSQFPNGHLHLQGHTVIDITYAVAARAFLDLWGTAPDPSYLEAAIALGDRLLEYEIAGSVNHGAMPCYCLPDLYEITGEVKYLRAAERRIRRTALAFQLPYGGWAGHESWIWYHAITTRAMVELYQALPFTSEHRHLKDRLALAITRALNRFLLAQKPGGDLRQGRADRDFDERDEYGGSGADGQVEIAADGRFVPAKAAEFRPHHYVLDTLSVCARRLPARELEPVAHGVFRHLAAKKVFWRFEFLTHDIGAYAELIAWLQGRPDAATAPDSVTRSSR